MVRNTISRRKLLAGIGAGSAILSGFARNRMADAAPKGNFLMYTTPNGFVRSAFGASGSGDSMVLLPSLKALEPFKNDITVIRGLSNQSASSFNSHEDMCKMLTCVHGGGDKSTVYAPSFDHIIGQKLGERPLTLAPPQSRGANIYAAVSWTGPNKVDPYVTDPLQAFLTALGGISADGSGGADSEAAEKLKRLLERRKSVLDFARADIGKFRSRLSSTDANNLDQYLGAIRGLEKDFVEQPAAAPVAAASCALTLANQKATKYASTGPVGEKKAIGIEAHMDIITTAFGCGARRIATLAGAENINPFGGKDHHGVSHGEAPLQVWKDIDTWYAQRFAYLLGQLKATGQLDHTIVAWSSDIAENHNQSDCVFIVAGGRALGMKLGQSIRYPFKGNSDGFQEFALAQARNPGNRSFHDLWVSVQKALGINENTFGDKQWCTGGLQELYAG